MGKLIIALAALLSIAAMTATADAGQDCQTFCNQNGTSCHTHCN